MAKTGIIGAMDIEVSKLIGAMRSPRRSVTAGIACAEGILCGSDTVIAQCGIGKVNAAVCAQVLISEYGAARLINTGIAGAVSPLLRPGSLVLSTDAVQHDVDVTGFGYAPTVIPGMEAAFRADALLLDAACRAARRLGLSEKTLSGRIATGDAFIASSAKKAAINALCSPLCVEMEGGAAAQAAVMNGVPFLIIRCISDMADDSGGKDYEFNAEEAAATSAALVMALLEELR